MSQNMKYIILLFLFVQSPVNECFNDYWNEYTTEAKHETYKGL
jgi:hypothetical protein